MKCISSSAHVPSMVAKLTEYFKISLCLEFCYCVTRSAQDVHLLLNHLKIQAELCAMGR